MRESSVRELRVNLEFERDKESRISCGIVCIHILMRYYGVRISREQISRMFNHKDRGMWISDMGLISLDRGLKARICTYSTALFDPSWFSLGIRGLLDRLEGAVSRETRPLIDAHRSIMEFLKCGGELCFKIIERDDLVSCLANNQPVILSVASDILHNKAGRGMHFIMVVGHRSREFTICNPGRIDIVEERIPEAKLFFSLYKVGGWGLFVSK
jgi:hypothetical protein